MSGNNFGHTLWGKDWVRFAEPLRQTRPDPQLPRARRIARDGKVQVTIDGRIVRAVVQHGRNAAVANIEVAPMSREAMAGIARQLCGVRLVLTDELYRATADAGHRPAPKLVGVDCSCSADTPRCIHVLAVYYEMARNIDDDPRISLDIQGFFRASSDSTEVSTAVTPQRWIALNALNPADYFMVST
ncbi:SWIM zinc finger-containing protein [Streptomyces roseochromogenus]|uniref:SWIM zinc finger-containing protein n=1 Tax=Streptomyces roseochromogenus subsp. oscitans DS 12.976 TaxID=1352936 RepID=V6KJ63_STRRC|nr:SWIM zinc finger-containing protein [Streptomyces roseochromogenus]EST29034.1 SWIM zinc finger-containing protein [Streptomyces roseochromogenus subsp. oscitans DS 12.976]